MTAKPYSDIKLARGQIVSLGTVSGRVSSTTPHVVNFDRPFRELLAERSKGDLFRGVLDFLSFEELSHWNSFKDGWADDIEALCAYERLSGLIPRDGALWNPLAWKVLLMTRLAAPPVPVGVRSFALFGKGKRDAETRVRVVARLDRETRRSRDRGRELVLALFTALDLTPPSRQSAVTEELLGIDLGRWP